MVLIFSSCLDNLNLGLANNEMFLLEQENHFLKQQHSEFMISTVEKFLKKHNKTIHNIEKIYFTNGPGGFTGNRLGIVFVKTISILKDIQIFTIDTLSSLFGDESGMFSLDAKSGKFYTGEFIDGKLSDGKVQITEEDKTTITPNGLVIDNMIQKFTNSIKHNNIHNVTPVYVKDL